MWTKPKLSRLQKGVFLFLTLAFVWANLDVRSDGFRSWQGFPFTFHEDSDAGHVMYDGRIVVADIALAATVLTLFLLFFRSSHAVASVPQVLALATFSAIYLWLNVDAWFGWPMAWLWIPATATYGFPFAYQGYSGAMRLGTGWAIIPNVLIGLICYRVIDHAFATNRRHELHATGADR